jgi:hypothetical protein
MMAILKKDRLGSPSYLSVTTKQANLSVRGVAPTDRLLVCSLRSKTLFTALSAEKVARSEFGATSPAESISASCSALLLFLRAFGFGPTGWFAGIRREGVF